MDRVNQYAKWILRTAIICSLVLTLMTKHLVGTAGGTAVLVMTFVVDYINNKFYKINITITSMVYIYCLFSLVLGNMWDFYDKIEWWDTLMHILSGIILGIIGDTILDSPTNGENVSVKVRLLFIIGIACIGGVVWEIFEFSVDSLLNLDTQLAKNFGVTDTMWDLIADFIGGAATGLFLTCCNKKK